MTKLSPYGKLVIKNATADNRGDIIRLPDHVPGRGKAYSMEVLRRELCVSFFSFSFGFCLVSEAVCAFQVEVVDAFVEFHWIG